MDACAQWEHGTLYPHFSGLPRSCTSFDLIERIPEPGGFEVRNIGRNKTDVYEVEFL